MIKHGKQAIIITMNNINNDQLLNFYDIDIFVNTACPRVAIEDSYRFDKPIINYKELLIALDESTFEKDKNNIIIAPYEIK